MTAPVQCGDVRDLLKTVRNCLNDGLHRRGAHLNSDQYEEAFSYLCLKAWEEWLRFDPWYKATRERSFNTFLYRRLVDWRLDEWFRQEYGDSRYGKNRIPVELRDDEKDLVGKACEWAEVVASVNTAYLSPVNKLTHERLAIPHYVAKAKYDELAAETGIPIEVISKRLKSYKAEIGHIRSRGLLVAA